MGIRDLAKSAMTQQSSQPPITKTQRSKRKRKTVIDYLHDLKKELGIDHIPDYEIRTRKRLVAKVGKAEYAKNQQKYDLYLRIYRSKLQFQLFLDFINGW